MRGVPGLLVVVTLLLGACGGEDGVDTVATDANAPEATPTDPSPAEVTTPEEPGMDPTTPPTDPTLEEMVQESVADLALRLEVDTDTIEVVRAEAVTWPDGSLGCPQPGMAYTQALVEGYQVILDHDSRVYLYHAAGDGLPFLCPSAATDGGHDFVPPPGLDE